MVCSVTGEGTGVLTTNQPDGGNGWQCDFVDMSSSEKADVSFNVTATAICAGGTAD